ncbi:MAG: magnesium/cobalt transporter CorA [Thermosynechococcaceae cyanobacterium]
MTQFPAALPEYTDYFYDQPGSAPGTLTIDEDAYPPEITLIEYNEELARRAAIANPEDCAVCLATEMVSWVDVQGLGNESILRRIGQTFSLHPLILEDVVNVPQRSKVETYENQLVIVARMVLPSGGEPGFTSEQVSFVLQNHTLLTVQEHPGDCFEPVRQRIRFKKGLIRRMGADYLAYSLLDAVVDGFFPIMEAYSDQLEVLEDEILLNPSRELLNRVHTLKRELLSLRRLSWSQRDAIASLLRDDSPLISDEVKVYLRDCHDHAIQILEMVETYREFAASLMDVYLSSVSNRMNEVMKILTVISTIFIPLTFIAGIYGMNFKNMPELNWDGGYPMVWFLMGAIASSLVYFFWRRGWFSSFSG